MCALGHTILFDLLPFHKYLIATNISRKYTWFRMSAMETTSVRWRRPPEGSHWLALGYNLSGLYVGVKWLVVGVVKKSGSSQRFLNMQSKLIQNQMCHESEVFSWLRKQNVQALCPTIQCQLTQSPKHPEADLRLWHIMNCRVFFRHIKCSVSKETQLFNYRTQRLLIFLHHPFLNQYKILLKCWFYKLLLSCWHKIFFI